jgi:four helix bundle protein
MRNYQDLQVWAKAHALLLDLYHVSRGFPKDELYGITSQVRRAVLSIGSNLAEGCGRRTSGEMARSIRVAMGSASELDYQVLVCRDLGYMKADDYQRMSKKLVEVRKMLTAFLDKVEAQIDSQAKGTAGA